HRPIEASQDNDGSIHRGVAIVAFRAKMLEVLQDVSRAHLVGEFAGKSEGGVGLELTQARFIGRDRERSQAPRDAVRARVERDPVAPLHLAPPSLIRATASSRRPGIAWRYTPVSEGLRCPMSEAITAISTPRSMRWLAKECRSVFGVTRLASWA